MIISMDALITECCLKTSFYSHTNSLRDILNKRQYGDKYCFRIVK